MKIRLYFLFLIFIINQIYSAEEINFPKDCMRKIFEFLPSAEITDIPVFEELKYDNISALLVISPDKIALGTENGSIYIKCKESGWKANQVAHLDGRVNKLKISPNGKYLAFWNHKSSIVNPEEMLNILELAKKNTVFSSPAPKGMQDFSVNNAAIITLFTNYWSTVQIINMAQAVSFFGNSYIDSITRHSYELKFGKVTSEIYGTYSSPYFIVVTPKDLILTKLSDGKKVWRVTKLKKSTEDISFRQTPKTAISQDEAIIAYCYLNNNMQWILKLFDLLYERELTITLPEKYNHQEIVTISVSDKNDSVILLGFKNKSILLVRSPEIGMGDLFVNIKPIEKNKTKRLV